MPTVLEGTQIKVHFGKTMLSFMCCLQFKPWILTKTGMSLSSHMFSFFPWFVEANEIMISADISIRLCISRPCDVHSAWMHTYLAHLKPVASFTANIEDIKRVMNQLDLWQCILNVGDPWEALSVSWIGGIRNVGHSCLSYCSSYTACEKRASSWYCSWGEEARQSSCLLEMMSLKVY